MSIVHVIMEVYVLYVNSLFHHGATCVNVACVRVRVGDCMSNTVVYIQNIYVQS